MDASVVAAIASATVSLLAPYLKILGDGLVKKTGEGVGAKMGETAWGKAEQLYEIVKAKFGSKPEDTKIINTLAESPNDTDTQAMIRFRLKEMMDSDETFARKLADILKEASESGADTVFQTTIEGDVQKFVQMGNVYGDVKI